MPNQNKPPSELRQLIDTNQYGIGLTKFIQVCKQLGLLCTHQQAHTAESIWDAMIELSVIREYFATYEPHLVHQCKAHHLQHCHFWAAGVNDIWAVDQHDKWICFGLALHTGIEPFSRKILWIHIWHSNRNPQLILTYFLDVVNKLRFIPLVTQSDPGSENYGIANAQTMLCQWHNPALGPHVVTLVTTHG
ncbi:hypothetical protein EDC04DRAFT_2605131 [Pisolithus marmoratus]|nr:hypothetical protein EDC04DRAFT_2605131 [Pisolithus marmoratus]